MAYTTIDDPTIYFTTNLRSGLYGGSDTAFNIGFQPDWIWNKKRSGTGVHSLFDSVRGFGASGKVLYSHLTNAEGTNALIKSVSSTGYTITASSDDTGTMVDWCWKASGSTASNTDGSITSTVSANQTAGFSIVSWTGDNSGSATIGHGLGAIPDVVIIKNRTDATNWGVKHRSMTSGHMAVLNGTDPSSDRNGSTNGGIGNLTSSTTFGFIGGGAGVPEVNGSSDSMIGYCFTSIKGFSKHGSYVANGDVSGAFVFTGFKIGWLMIKRTDSAAGWIIYDSKREGRNTENDYLLASSTAAEGGNNEIDLYSNGFKPREANRNELNVSGASYVYLAFAESPFVTSTGIPTTAR